MTGVVIEKPLTEAKGLQAQKGVEMRCKLKGRSQEEGRAGDVDRLVKSKSSRSPARCSRRWWLLRQQELNSHPPTCSLRSLATDRHSSGPCQVLVNFLTSAPFNVRLR
jgi:hypothetical protein